MHHWSNCGPFSTKLSVRTLKCWFWTSGRKNWDFFSIRTQKWVRPKCHWNEILVLFEYINLVNFLKNHQNFPIYLLYSSLYLVLGRQKGLGRGLMHPWLEASSWYWKHEHRLHITMNCWYNNELWVDIVKLQNSWILKLPDLDFGSKYILLIYQTHWEFIQWTYQWTMSLLNPEVI